MKISDIVCNGVGPIYSTLQSNNHVQTMVSIFRMRYSVEEIFEKFKQDDNYYMGVRFNSDDDVTGRIMSAITEKICLTYFKKPIGSILNEDILLVSGVIESFVNSLSGSEMDQLIIEGMRDCANCDHWYEFEKEWY